MILTFVGLLREAGHLYIVPLITLLALADNGLDGGSHDSQR